jgi:hypothetical protein
VEDSSTEELFDIDRSKWQKPSYLGHYDVNAAYYEGLRTSCRKCGVSFVFSAQAQKYAFEIEQRYPGWLPTLCPTCYREWEALEQKILKYEHFWEENRTVLALGREFLGKWLVMLKEARPYGKKDFESRIRMLIKVIGELG